jgi:PAS domain S-box-containing protein
VTKDEADETGASVQRTERRFDASQAIAGLGSWEFDPSTGERWWSAGCARLFGFEGSIDVLPLDELRDRIHPDDRETLGSIVAESAREPAAQTAEFRAVLPDNHVRWLEGRFEPWSGPIGGVQWRGTVQDITTHHDEAELGRRISRARTALSECNRALTRATDEQELLDAICRIAVGLAGYSLAWVGFAEDDERKTVRPVARYGEAAPYLDEISVTWGDDALGRGPTGTAIRTGRVRLARGLVVEPSYELWHATAARHGLASSLALPLLKDDVAFGAFMVYAPEPDAFGDTETEMLVELADDLAFGIRTLRERSERRRLATAVEQVVESVIITDADARITYVNPAFERVTGYTRDEVIGKNPRFLKSGLHMPSFYDAMWAALTNRLPWVADLVNRRKDGTLFTEETVISPIRDASGAITSYVAVKRDVTHERALEERSSHLARERALIAETIRGLHASDTPEATAQAICRRVMSLTGVMAAQISLFELDGRAWPIGFVVEDQSDPPLRRLPEQRSRHLREHAAEGPWIEPWANRPSNPYNQLLTGLGVREIACAPVRHDQQVIGLLVIYTAGSVEEVAVTEALPALAEFADLAGALIGRDVAERTEAGRGRNHIAGVIARRAFRPVFQPIVELASNEIVGYEALTRFTDGANPEVIFTDASAVGLGVELEMATLQGALAAAEALPPSVWLNLNASPELILAGEPLRSLLAGSRRRLVLEVTEHAAIADYPAFRAAMDAFGPEVEFAVDDAGTGFASLRHIVELHPTFVKLDRSLMAGLESDDARQAMIVGLCHFAHVTGCRLIVEGIETDRELAVLRALTIELGQGYLLGRPLPVEDV